jgi:hypothetical protein
VVAVQATLMLPLSKVTVTVTVTVRKPNQESHGGSHVEAAKRSSIRSGRSVVGMGNTALTERRMPTWEERRPGLNARPG